MDLNTLTLLAGERSTTRGLNYFNEGRVGSLTISGDQVVALVEGREPYSVTLTITESTLEGECSCPASGHSEFCKHCVAVALAWEHEKRAPNWLVSHLKRLKKEQLIEHLVRQIMADEDLANKWQRRITTTKLKK
ncbi:SWIM zinc finger family protein [Ferrimonas sp.]|uniref:SWIM zinc finger family protein n=1 Tax=Ferrimonas sp. TaxID=2080861 RepID=UPI003A92C853